MNFFITERYFCAIFRRDLSRKCFVYYASRISCTYLAIPGGQPAAGAAGQGAKHKKYHGDH